MNANGLGRQIAAAEASLDRILTEHNALPDTAHDQLAARRQEYGDQQTEYLQLLAAREAR